MRNRLLRVVAVVAAVGILAGCSSAADPASSPSPTGEPVDGGTLTHVEPLAVGSWQPHQLQGYQYTNLYAAIADNLLYYDVDEGLVPWLAESYETNETNTEFTFTLREGVTFSEGTALDAAAVVSNFDQIGLGDEALGLVPSAYFTGYDHSEAVDDLTVKVVFSEPHSRFLRLTATAVASIVAPSTLELSAEEQALPENVVASGPFVFSSERAGEEIVLTKRDDYAWAPENADNQGAAHIDELVFRFSGEPSVRQQALLSDQAQTARGILATDEAALAAAGGVVLPADGSRSIYSFSLLFRPQNELVSDVRVRHAIGIAFDREQLVEATLSDSYRPATSFFGRTYEGYVDLSDELTYDPDRAVELLEDAGWQLNSDGIREKDGQELRLVVASNSQTAEAKNVLDFIAQQLAEIGIVLENRAGDDAFANYANDETTGNEVPVTASRAWVQNGLEGRWDKGLLNFTVSEELNDLIYGERTASSEQEGLDYLREQQEFLITDNWWVAPIFEDVQVFGSTAAVHGLTFSGYLAPNFQSAWLSE